MDQLPIGFRLQQITYPPLRQTQHSGLVLHHVHSENLQHHVPDFVEFPSQLLENLSRDPLVLLEQSQEQVFAADHIVAQLARRLAGQFDDPLGARGEGELTKRHRGRTTQRDHPVDLHANPSEVHIEVLEDFRGDAASAYELDDNRRWDWAHELAAPFGFMPQKLAACHASIVVGAREERMRGPD